MIALKKGAESLVFPDGSILHGGNGRPGQDRTAETIGISDFVLSQVSCTAAAFGKTTVEPR